MLKIDHTPKIVAPQVPARYFSRERLLQKIQVQKDSRLILVTAPAGYGKTSLAVEFFHELKNELKLWISISRYDSSLENFFLLLAMAFSKYVKPSGIGESLKKVLSQSQNIPLDDKINLIVSSFASELFEFLQKKKKGLYLFLDDFHNIDDSEEVSEALNYLLDYLPDNIHIVVITRRDPVLLNFPKFLAKGWLGRITKSDLTFSDTDVRNLLKTYKKLKVSFDRKELEDYVRETEGWVTAIQLLLISGSHKPLEREDLLQSKTDLFDYFTSEIYGQCTAEEKELMLSLSFAEEFNKEIIEEVIGFKGGFGIIMSLYEKNMFIDREDSEFRFHELFLKFLRKEAASGIPESRKREILSRLGCRYLSFGEWRDEFIGLNYLIQAADYDSLRNWIRLNASDKLLLIHSSGLYDKIEAMEEPVFRDSLENILLKVNTLIYKDKEIEKALSYLEGLLRSKFTIPLQADYLLPYSRISKNELNYYVEILMLICNCNFLKEGISARNIKISEHLLKFDLKIEQEIQFIASLIKSYITSGENSKSKKHIQRLKVIFEGIQTGKINLSNDTDENAIVESVFSMLIFFDYGDFKWGNNVIRFILSNCDRKSFDISNYSQACFALFASYNLPEFETFYQMLANKHKQKKKTIFSAYKNQFEFQTILRKFLHFEFEEVIRDLERMKKDTFLKNYIYFIDSLIIYSYCLLNHPRAVLRHLESGKYRVSKTREIILKLEAYLLLGDFGEFELQMNRVKKLRLENFTLFNQAVINFYECYYFMKKNNTGKFSEKFRLFMKFVEENEFDKYLTFRAKSNKLSEVFDFAAKNGFADDYITRFPNVFTPESEKVLRDKKELTIDVRFLDHNKIFINGRELTDNLWLRPKSKMIFLYCVYKVSVKDIVTKEKMIDDILYKAKDVNYDAIVDVEVNKVRKTLQKFLSDSDQGEQGRKFMILKDKKYMLCSNDYELVINTDIEEFKHLSSGEVSDMLKAVEAYKSDFMKESYRNWSEDIRENLKFIYSDTIHKLITHFENSDNTDNVVMLLEKLLELDYTDEEIMMKLLSLYNREKDYRKFRYAYGLYEKRLKKEFNVQPSSQLKNFFKEVITQN